MSEVRENLSSSDQADSVSKDHQPQEVLAFNHKYKGADTKLHVYFEPQHDKGLGPNFTEVTIRDEGGQLIGIMDGNLEDEDKKIFHTATISNETNVRLLHRSTVPRAVGSAIGNLVKTGILDEWHSSHEGMLSRAGREMYEKFLRADPDLIILPPTEDSDLQYVVKKKPSGSMV